MLSTSMIAIIAMQSLTTSVMVWDLTMIETFARMHIKPPRNLKQQNIMGYWNNCIVKAVGFFLQKLILDLAELISGNDYM